MKKIPVFLFLLVGLIPFTNVTGQGPFRQLKMEHWDANSGMPNDLILNVYQTKDGYIWMTGYAGLVRFDGISFTAFNSRTVPQMKTDNIESLLCETSDSTLWIPTPNSGLLSYKHGVFKAYTQYTMPLFLIGKSAKDALLFSTGRGSKQLILFDTRTKELKKITAAEGDSLFEKRIILSLQPRVEKSGDIWLPGVNNFSHFTGGKLEKVMSSGDFMQDLLMDVYVDAKNRSWLVAENGLFIWDGKLFKPFPGMEKIRFTRSASSTGAILEDRRGGIWVTTAKGIAYLEPQAQRFVFYPPGEPLLAQSMNNIMEDREGNIWFSSAKGLIKLSYSKFINYSKVDGLPAEKVSAVCALDNNHYIVGSGGKLSEIDSGQVHPYKFRNTENQNFISEQNFLFKDSKNNIWACYGSGKLMRLSKTGEKIFQMKGIAQPRYVFEDEQHKLWFGIAYGGIAFLDKNDNLEFLNIPKVDFSTLFISSIRKIKNGNWLITSYNKGVFEIDPQGNPTHYTEASGLKALGVFNSYEEPDGTIWFTSQSGVARFRNGVIQNIGFTSGLPDNSVFQFIPDHNGYVWFTSNHGLIRAKKQELNDYLDKGTTINWQVYDDGDGMLNRQCVGARHSAITPDGRLLIQTFGGLLEVNPDKLQKNMVAPTVVINRVIIDNTDRGLAQNQVFNPGNHRYIFDYSGLSLVAPQKVRFKFKLIGYDKDFITAAGDRKAFYTNIPSGKYTFLVIASNNDGVWNNIGASYSFTITPFFYETIWFKMVSLAALIFLAWLLVRWRTATTRKEKERLEAEVAQRTSQLNKANKELSESLNTLKTTQAQLIQAEKMASLGELTAGIAHEIQNPLNFVNNFSEINKELLAEMNGEIDKGNMAEVKAIAKDVSDNEEKIIHHGKRADAIVKGMLQHSRSSSGTKEATDINALCDEYLRLAYHGLRAKDKSFNATIQTNFDPGVGNIPVVPQDLGRVMLNLITNAFYAVDEKQKAGSGTSNGEPYQPSVTISTKKQKDSIELSVKDNGNGIPDAIKEKIFQPFFTTKPTGQGTGLGLSLSYDIVKAHGGNIKVDTKAKEFTEFTIVLPL